MSPDQLELLLEGSEAKKPGEAGQDAPADEEKLTPLPESKKKKKRKPRLPDDLPVEERVLLPKEVEEEPEAFRQVGEEVTTQLDYHPARFIKKVTRRLKFVPKLRVVGEEEGKEQFYIHPLPPCLQERSLLTPSLAAEVVSNRFCEHQPYYRQEQKFLRQHGVYLPRNTLCNWMGVVAHDWLSGIYRHMHGEMLQGGYLQIDETPIDYLAPGHGSTKKGYLWTIAKPEWKSGEGRGDILYFWQSSRSHHCLKDLLERKEERKKNFTGILQCDGYRAYRTYQKGRGEEIKLAACWAHVRRKFYEARGHKPKLTGWVLGQIGQLYRIERHLRKQRAGPALREALRAHQSLPIYRRLKKALLIIRKKTLPKSPLGKAIDYALAEWDKLGMCLQDGRLEIDNNLIERFCRVSGFHRNNFRRRKLEESIA